MAPTRHPEGEGQRTRREDRAVTATGPGRVYVYYRVARDTADARAALTALLAAVEAATGTRGELLARCDDPATWMEVYAPAGDPAAFVRRVEALAREHAAAALAADGRRHVECFAPLPPLAAARRRSAPRRRAGTGAG